MLFSQVPSLLQGAQWVKTVGKTGKEEIGFVVSLSLHVAKQSKRERWFGLSFI
jgi:hypothetical protein